MTPQEQALWCAEYNLALTAFGRNNTTSENRALRKLAAEHADEAVRAFRDAQKRFAIDEVKS